MTQPTQQEDTQPNPSRLTRETAERQDLDELVADGLDDEANVEDSGALSAEEGAMTVVEVDPDAVEAEELEPVE